MRSMLVNLLQYPWCDRRCEPLDAALERVQKSISPFGCGERDRPTPPSLSDIRETEKMNVVQPDQRSPPK